MYRAAATYLSSRAFPSTLLSATPSLIASPSSYQVLLPGVDSLNHKRGHPAIWKVSKNDKFASTSEVDKVDDHLSIELSSEVAYQQGDELFNNYGPKPNSSLILGYGFALPDNPDDTILLKIGSSSNYQVGSSTSGFCSHEFLTYMAQCHARSQPNTSCLVRQCASLQSLIV